MKKLALLLLALVLSVGFSLSTAQAGQICWNWEPFADIIKVSTTNTLSGHVLVNGEHYVSGIYYMPVVGTMNKLNGTTKILGLHEDSGSAGYEQCVVHATLDSITKSGPITISCNNGAFTNTGTLTKISCNTVAPFSLTPLQAGNPGIQPPQ